MADAKKLMEILMERYGDNGLKKGVLAAPGRVNLIGEHTDYNDGFVLPMAIEKEIAAAAQLRDDNQVVVYDVNFAPEMEFSLDNLQPVSENTWVNYLMGVADEMQKKGYNLQGMNMVLEGNVPLSSGLSSSAALEVVTAMAFAFLNSLDIEPVEMALLCQAAENNFVGVNCGIMDQYISRLGKKGHALMIDCRSFDYQLVPFKTEDYKIVICNSNVQRELVDSAYNQRREECNQAAEFFADRLDKKVTALRDVSPQDFEKYSAELPDTVARRARHVIYENQRVLDSVKALRNNDFKQFGDLMIESHHSLQQDYEVSCQELDILVELALKQQGVAGARMTGAGFGGCTVNLVKEDRVAEFKENVAKGYLQQTDIETDFYVSYPAEGARVISK